MIKTIELIPKSTKWIYLFNGIVNSIIGIQQLLTSDTWSWLLLFGLILTVGGPLMIIYSLILFSRTSVLTPRIQIDETGVLIREDIHRGQKKIEWKDVKEITYRPFELNFHLTDDNTETLSLPTSGEISIDVKKTIREFADSRQINIIGG
jgi:hypothetical protein